MLSCVPAWSCALRNAILRKKSLTFCFLFFEFDFLELNDESYVVELFGVLGGNELLVFGVPLFHPGMHCFKQNQKQDIHFLRF